MRDETIHSFAQRKSAVALYIAQRMVITISTPSENYHIHRHYGTVADYLTQRKPLQTGFTAGMEWCLGVIRQERHTRERGDGEADPHEDVREADALMEAEGNDPARLRYSKMFWEAVPDGQVRIATHSLLLRSNKAMVHAIQDPITPFKLLEARERGQKRIKREAMSKNCFLPDKTHHHDTVKMVAPQGRPAIKFIDVGGKFIDKKEISKRIKKQEHRGLLKDKKYRRRLRTEI